MYSVLDCLKRFLPEMQAANSRLDQQNIGSLTDCNMENLEHCDGPVIEMVGVLHLRFLIQAFFRVSWWRLDVCW
jgi:hypothetical protein